MLYIISVGTGKLWWMRRIFAQISQNLPEKFVCHFCLQIFSHKDHEDLFHEGLFVVISKKLPSFVVLQSWAPLFEEKTLDAIFSRIFRDFVKIVRNFARIFDKSKLLGVRLHPLHHRLLHHCYIYINKLNVWVTFQ